MFRRCFALLFVLRWTAASITCKNQQGQAVDWFSAYKVPKLQGNKNPNIAHGDGFFYLDSTNPTWQLSSVGLSNSNQAIGYTMQQIYSAKNNSNTFYLMYNDEWPDGNYNLSGGHTKGVVLFDQTSGIWVVHSVPKFPDVQSYSWPSNALIYGQSFLCITFNYQQLNEIGKQLLFTQFWAYASQLPSAIAGQNPDLASAVAGNTVTVAPYTRQTILTSKAGVSFTSFTKSGKWRKDLYHDLVAPGLGTALYAETWQNEGSNMGSWCTGSYDVHDISSIQLPNSITFPNNEDHSKWAVADNNATTQAWVCIGDINRQYGQEPRGGGTVCLLNQNLWTTFHNSAVKINQCKS